MKLRIRTLIGKEFIIKHNNNNKIKSIINTLLIINNTHQKTIINKNNILLFFKGSKLDVNKKLKNEDYKCNPIFLVIKHNDYSNIPLCNHGTRIDINNDILYNYESDDTDYWSAEEYIN